MMDTIKKVKDQDNGGMNPITTAVAGVVVGAIAVGVAGATILSDDNNRKKLEKVIDGIKDNAADLKASAEEQIAEGKDKASEVIEAGKGSTQDVVKDAKQNLHAM